MSELVTTTITRTRPRLPASHRQDDSRVVRAMTATEQAWFVLRAEPAAARALALAARPAQRSDVHLRSRVDSYGNEEWCSGSDVLYIARTVASAADVAETLWTYPGAAVCLAATESHHLAIAIRWHTRSSVLDGDVGFALGSGPVAAFGSAVHAWLAAGLSPLAITGLALGRGRIVRLTSVVPGHITGS